MLTECEVDGLLSGACVKLGFCLSPAEQARLRSAPPSDIGEFTRAIIIADGLDPETCPHYSALRDLVTQTFEGSRSRL
jgi:hypothetical protein